MGLSRDAGTSQAFWDSFSHSYGPLQQADAPGRIVAHLVHERVLDPAYSILEVAAGPGTYTGHLARNLTSVTATDISCRMLDINRQSMASQGLHNVSHVVHDWHHDPLPDRHDACITAFMPMADRPESLLRMESCSGHVCIIVAWDVNHGEDVTNGISRGLGIDWPHPAHDRALERLEGLGRDAHRIVFDAHVRADVPMEDVIAKEVSRFASAGYDASSVAEEVVSGMCQDGVMHYDHVNRIGVTYWYIDDRL